VGGAPTAFAPNPPHSALAEVGGACTAFAPYLPPGGWRPMPLSPPPGCQAGGGGRRSNRFRPHLLPGGRRSRSRFRHQPSSQL